MLRFTVRDGCWLMVALVVAATVYVMPLQWEKSRRSVTRPASKHELEIIEARYQAAKGEFDHHLARTMGSGVWPSANEYCAAVERFAQATEARDDLEARVKDLASALNFAQQKVSITLDKYGNEVEPANAVYRFQYTRADIEARLRRAEQDLAAAQATW